MQGKKLTFIVASLMAIGVYAQTTPPCTGFNKLDPTGTLCFVCPGDFCDSCSKDFECSSYALCPNPGQLPNTLGTACFSCDVADCLNCLAADYCQQCDTGFNRNQVDGTCYKCDNSLCKDCDPNDTAICTECVSATQKVDPTGNTCFECTIPGCSSCSANNVCAECANIAQKPNEAGNACIPCSGAFCSNCNEPNVCAVALPCTVATQKPNIAGDTCFDCQIIDCDRCDAALQCSKCVGNLVPNVDASACVSCFAGCKTCSDDNVCAQCQDPKQKPSCKGDACITCEATYCDTCSSANVCIKYALCPDAGQLTDSKGSACYPCDITGGSCLFCKGENVCQVCQDGFKPSADGSACVKCEIANCLECSQDNKCFTCKGLMVPSESKAVCVSCAIGCTKCNDAGLCLDCPKDCVNGCTDGKCTCPTTCTTKCDEKGNCIPQKNCPPNCLECDYSYKCNQNKCEDGYETTKWGACVKTTVKCPGSYVSADGSRCINDYYYH